MALLDSDRVVIGILGDGDFMQGGTALWTAAHYKLPVLIMVSNNRSNFNDEVHQEAMAKQRGRPVENRWIGQRIDDPALEEAIRTVEAGEPYFLDVVVQPGYSAPMVTRASGEASTGTAS